MLPSTAKALLRLFCHSFLQKGGLGHSNESLPITVVRNTAQRSFSKLRLIKTFHRPTMTNERLTNLAMISIESETAKI